MPDDIPEPRWLPLREAAPLLGLERDTLRKQLARGERLGRRDNRKRWLVPVPASAGLSPGMVPAAIPEAPRADAGASRIDAGTVSDPRDAELAVLRERAAVAEAVAAELRRELGEVRGDVAILRAERDQLQAELLRRRWPGAIPWLRRALWGDRE